MRTLHLLRHGKSSWDDPSIDDADRPLAPRGRRAVMAVRDHFAGAALSVDLVLVSSARRARETWDGVASAVRAGRVLVEPVIYEASMEDLLTLVRGVDDDVRSLLLVGHNPSFETLTLELAGSGEPHALARLADKFPTGAMATLHIDCSWADVDVDCARLVEFVRPRDLSG